MKNVTGAAPLAGVLRGSPSSAAREVSRAREASPFRVGRGRVPRGCALVLAAWLAAVAMPLAAQQQPAQPGVQRTNGGIMIDFQGTDIRLAIAALAEAAGLNVIFGEIPPRPIQLRTSTPVPVSQVRVFLESVLKANNLELREEAGGLFRISSTEQAAQPGVVPGQPQYPVQQGGPLGIHVYQLRHAPAEDVARSIGALFGLGDGTLNASRPRSLSEELRDQVLGPDGQPQAAAQGPRLQAQGSGASLSGQVQVFADQRTNSLMIRANAADYAVLAQAIAQLDRRPLQVLIEVLIAEVRRDRQTSVGLTVQLPDQELDRGSNTRLGGELLGSDAGDVVLRITRLGGVDANIILRALASSGQVNILSRPVIMAQNNEEARILVGDQRPFIQISRALPTDNAVRDQVIQYRDVGTQLTIRPTVNPDGYVTLTVLQEVSTATNQTQFGAPIISTREAETRLLVKNGQTVVIGGLIDQLRTTTNSGIPILKDIPVLGNLFRSTSRQTAVTELFLFLTPHVLFNDEDVERATQEVRSSAPRLDQALPDSIPLYWRLSNDTLVIPTGPQQPARPGVPPRPPARQPQPQPQPQAPPPGAAPAPPQPPAPGPTSFVPLPASPLIGERRYGRRSGARRRTGSRRRARA